MAASAESLDFVQQANARKRKFRLVGFGIPFVIGFVSLMLSGSAGGSIGVLVFAGSFIGVCLGMVGLVIAEVLRYFHKDQRTMAALHIQGAMECPNCKKMSPMKSAGEKTIEHFVQHKNQQVYENGVSFRKDVPYNCRRFWKITKCTNCGHTFKREETEERRA